MRRISAVTAILVGGTIAGTFDIAYAILFSAFRGVSAVRVLQSVASGLLGWSAYGGGLPTAVLGLSLHFFIAISAAAIFYGATRWLPCLPQRAIIAGPIYGVVIFTVMNLVVIPLSAFPTRIAFSPFSLTTGLAAHMFLVGLPIALAVRRTEEKTDEWAKRQI